MKPVFKTSGNRAAPSLKRDTMKKVNTEYLEYLWPMRHYLITCGHPEQSNIIAVSFCMPVSKEPPMAACAVGKSAYSRELIEQAGEFVINVPSEELKRHIYYCGSVSGRDADKFRETGLTKTPARSVTVPVIDECVAHMECRVEQAVSSGDKILYIGAVVAAYADEDVVSGGRDPVFAAGSFPAGVYGGREK